MPKETKDVYNGVKEIAVIQRDTFKQVVNESKIIDRKERKDFKTIANKPILVQRFVFLYVSGMYTDSQIASMMGVSKTTVKSLLKNAAIQEQIFKYQAEEKEIVDSRLKALRNKALDTMDELLDSQEDTVRLNASKDILDRSGHAVKKDNNLNINVSYEQKLQELSSSIDMSMIDQSLIVDGEIIED